MEFVHKSVLYDEVIESLNIRPNCIYVDGTAGGAGHSKGIAEKLEEIHFPNDSVPLYIDKNSESLKVIQRMRDEAHRFGITHHRKKRSKAQVVSELDSIKGIGIKTKELLIKTFKSVKRVKETDYQEIANLIGRSKADILINGLKK